MYLAVAVRSDTTLCEAEGLPPRYTSSAHCPHQWRSHSGACRPAAESWADLPEMETYNESRTLMATGQLMGLLYTGA